MRRKLLVSNQYQFLLYFSPINKSNNIIVYLKTTINGKFNIKCYDLEYVVPSYLIPISNKYVSSLPSLHDPIEEHDNTTDGNNQRESIKPERSFSIVTQECTYDYNDKFWYHI